MLKGLRIQEAEKKMEKVNKDFNCSSKEKAKHDSLWGCRWKRITYKINPGDGIKFWMKNVGSVNIQL